MKMLSNLKGIDKTTFDLLDNLLKHSSDKVYVTREDLYSKDPEYIISNFNTKEEDSVDEITTHFKIRIKTESVKIEIKKVMGGLMYLNIVYGANGLGNKSKEDLKPIDEMKEGCKEFDNLSSEIYHHFRSRLEEKVIHHREVEIKQYENTIYKILNVDRKVKIDKIINS